MSGDEHDPLAALEHDQDAGPGPAAAAHWDGVVRIRKPQPVTEVPSTFDDTDWSRYLLGAVSSGEAVRGAVVRNHEQVQRLRAQLANAERRAGHTNGRPIDPPCGYCELATQCERCAEIVRSSRAERERDQALARVAELEAIEQRLRGALRRTHDEIAPIENERDELRGRVADLEAQVRDQNDVLREQSTDLRQAERDAYNAWCRDS